MVGGHLTNNVLLENDLSKCFCDFGSDESPPMIKVPSVVPQDNFHIKDIM